MSNKELKEGNGILGHLGSAGAGSQVWPDHVADQRALSGTGGRYVTATCPEVTGWKRLVALNARALGL